jgi:hypothetical protein
VGRLEEGSERGKRTRASRADDEHCGEGQDGEGETRHGTADRGRRTGDRGQRTEAAR